MNEDTLLKDKQAVGVVICRMQVPHLTSSHASLIRTVLHRHKRVVICLGVTGKPIEPKNPFPFEFRKEMIEKKLLSMANDRLEENAAKNNVTIIPLPDQPDDNVWVSTLDLFVSAFVAKGEGVVLYGGRDSFIPYYTKHNGKYESRELAPEDYDSGTELRNLTALEQPKYSIEAAQGILWALRQVS